MRYGLDADGKIYIIATPFMSSLQRAQCSFDFSLCFIRCGIKHGVRTRKLLVLKDYC
jgi:hypothetical protein